SYTVVPPNTPTTKSVNASFSGVGGALQNGLSSGALPGGRELRYNGQPIADILSDGRIIAAGSGNIIAAGSGNVIAAGSGNVIAAGAYNIIAAGAGNVIAAGSGNFDDLRPSGGGAFSHLDAGTIMTGLERGLEGAGSMQIGLQT